MYDYECLLEICDGLRGEESLIYEILLELLGNKFIRASCLY